MELIGSPFITIILNVIAGGLVSHGILDEHARDTFVQLVNNAIAAAVTLGIALYSVYKSVDLHKHKMTTDAQKQGASATETVTTTTTIPSNVTPATATAQTGLPISTTNMISGQTAVE